MSGSIYGTAQRTDMIVNYCCSLVLIILAALQLKVLKSHPDYKMFPKFITELCWNVLFINSGVFVFQIIYTVNQVVFSLVFVAVFSVTLAIQMYFLTITYLLISLSYYRASTGIPTELSLTTGSNPSINLDEQEEPNPR